MPQFSVNLKTTIIAVLLIVVFTLSIFYSGLALYEHNLTVNSFAKSLFTEKQNAIKSSLTNRFNIQSKLGELAAASLPDIYAKQGMPGVEQYLLNNLKMFDEIAAAFFSTRDNDFAGYIHQDDFIHMFSNAQTNYDIIFKSSDDAGVDGELLNKTASFYATERPWYSSALSKDSQGFSGVFTYHAYRTLALPHSLPVFDDTGEVLGVIGTNIFLGEFAANLKQQMREVNGIAIILDEHNRLIASSTDVSPLMQLESSTEMLNAMESDNPFVKFAAVDHPKSAQIPFLESALTIFTQQEQEYLSSAFVFSDIPNLNWKVQLFIPRQEFTKNVTAFIQDFLVVLMLVLAFSVLLSIWLSRLISQPVSQIIERFSDFNENNMQPLPSEQNTFELKEVKDLRSAERKYKEKITSVIQSLQVTVAQNQQQLQQIQQLALVTQTVNDMFVIIGESDSLVWANQPFDEYFEFASSAGESRPCELFRHPLLQKYDFSTQLKHCFETFVKDNQLNSGKIQLGEQSYELRFFPVTAQQNSSKTLVMIRDVTEQTRYQNELQIWKQVFEATPVGIGISLNNNEIIDIANPALANIFRGAQEDFQGTQVNFFYPDDAQHRPEEILKMVREKGEATLEVEHIRKDGERFPALLSIAYIRNEDSDIIARVAMVNDLSEIKQIQQELFQSQKMQAIGTLAGGIVHDMNNVLAAIMGNAECGKLISQQATNDDANKNLKFFRSIINAAERGAKLTQQILSFSRMEALVLNPINIYKLISETVELLTATLPSNIECSFENSIPEDICIKGNESQLQQVILNLLNNSVKAISKTERVSGIIEISTKLQQKELLICVRDNGSGIKEENLPFLFDPFFTTESKGKGTGLGLAIVKRVLEAHKATINVSSTWGIGTSFTLRFSEFETAQQTSVEKKASATGRLQHANIVIVDDNEDILDVYSELFEVNNIHAVAFQDPIKAKDYCLEHGQEIDCLITDFDMPQLTGDKLIQALHKAHPHLKCIMSTGYSELLNEDRIADLAISKLLIKPVLISDLLIEVQQVLNA